MIHQDSPAHGHHLDISNQDSVDSSSRIQVQTTVICKVPLETSIRLVDTRRSLAKRGTSPNPDRHLTKSSPRIQYRRPNASLTTLGSYCSISAAGWQLPADLSLQNEGTIGDSTRSQLRGLNGPRRTPEALPRRKRSRGIQGHHQLHAQIFRQ
jgi:hypothetical protein